MSSEKINKIKEALKYAKSLNSRAEAASGISIEKIEDAAGRYSGSESSRLIGIIGGIIGGGVGGWLGSYLGMSISIASAGLAGCFLGVATFILFWRGYRDYRVEKANRILANTLRGIRREIDSLPSETPEEIRQELWNAYLSAIKEHRYYLGQSDDQEAPSKGKVELLAGGPVNQSGRIVITDGSEYNMGNMDQAAQARERTTN